MTLLNLISNQNKYYLFKNLGINNPTNRDQTYNKYNMQQPLINNNDVRQLPEKQIKTSRNLLNNRLLKRRNSVLEIDPQNKSRMLKNKPIEYEETNKPSNYKKIDRKKYWDSYLLKHNNIYDLPILVPTTNEVNSNDKSLKSKYSIFEDIIDVKKKDNLELRENFRKYNSSDNLSRRSYRRRSSKRRNKTYYNNPYKYYAGPYRYLPFGEIYYYDNIVVLPFNLNSALVPIYNPRDKLEKFIDNIPKGFKMVILKIREKKNSNRNSIIFIIMVILFCIYRIYGNRN